MKTIQVTLTLEVDDDGSPDTTMDELEDILDEAGLELASISAEEVTE